MNSELAAIVNYMEKERGIDPETLIEAIEFSLRQASRKLPECDTDLDISIDRKNYQINARANVEVVKIAKSKYKHISLAKAMKLNPDAKIGDFMDVIIEAKELGRIAAQTAKQAILQKIRQAERENIFDEYKDRIGDIVSGTIRQFNRSDIIIDLGRGEAILPATERVQTEEYQVGDRIRAYLLSVENTPSGQGIILSRSHPDFVRALFQLEVSEINDNIVEIKGIAREAGYRTKIAVISNDEKVDPVGACVGMRGIRVKNIVRELSGEKIDIVRWSEDIKLFTTNSLAPAKLASVWLDEKIPHLVHVLADADQLSLAIGKKGQNVRLTAKLVGWKIDIQKTESDTTFEDQVAHAIELMAGIDDIDEKSAETLVKSGFLTIEGVLEANIDDIIETTGFEKEKAQSIIDAATVYLNTKK